MPPAADDDDAFAASSYGTAPPRGGGCSRVVVGGRRPAGVVVGLAPLRRAAPLPYGYLVSELSAARMARSVSLGSVPSSTSTPR